MAENNQKSPATKPPAGRVILAWEAPEFRKYNNGSKWIMGIATVALLLGIFFGWQRNWSAMVVVLVGAFLFYSYGTRDPKTIRYSIDTQGFRRGDQLVPWDNLKSFWINEAPSGTTLYLETTSRFINFEKIDLENVGIADLRKTLTTRLPQNATRSEELFDRLSRILRF